MNDLKEQTLKRLKEALALLENCPEFVPFVPEVRTNIVFALPDARNPEDVAAIDGRITVVQGRPRACGAPEFGASDHLARLILELRQYAPEIRAAINFRWNEQLLAHVQHWAQIRGKKIGVIDRSCEPEELIGREKMSMPWKVKQLIARTGGAVPEIFYETRGWGKEPLFVLVGADPVNVVTEVINIARSYNQNYR